MARASRTAIENQMEFRQYSTTSHQQRRKKLAPLKLAEEGGSLEVSFGHEGVASETPQTDIAFN